MHFPIRAISLDLDDTLWPFAPIGGRIERLPLADRLSDHYVARYLRLDGQAAGTGHRP